MDTLTRLMSDPEWQRLVEERICRGREIYYCASMLIHELAQDEKYMDDLMPVLIGQDWIEAANDYHRDNPITDLIEAAGFCARHDVDVPDGANDGEVIEIANAHRFDDEEQARDYCERERIDPYETEAYEHWIVSDWLANRLEERGEMVLEDFLGLTIWGRCCTGQGISQDLVINQIVFEHCCEYWPEARACIARVESAAKEAA